MIIKNANLVQDSSITLKDIRIADGIISSITDSGGSVDMTEEVLDVHGLYLSHGFLDIHVHGGGGGDFMDGTKEAWHQAASLHLKHGTTGLLPTTLAAGYDELVHALELYNQLKCGFPDSARLLGIHIEGPYLSRSQCGAQDPAYIRDPNPGEYKELLSLCPDILRWTIAPELPGAFDMGDYLAERGVLPCIGHSDADYSTVREAVSHGYRHITHLYSAMSTIVRKGGFRQAGIVESAYLLPELSSEIISDGCHLPPSLLTMAYRLIGPDRLALVTDSMRAAGESSGTSILGSLKNGQTVILEDGVAKMPDRTAFAGSICTADRLVRNMVRMAGASLPDAIRMVTETPARIMNLDKTTGRVEAGRTADLVIFDDRINIRYVFIGGKLINQE